MACCGVNFTFTLTILCWEEKLVLQVVLRNFRKIFAWHCCNLRLYLAVRDIVGAAHGMNYFVILSTGCILYHQCPQNQQDLMNLPALGISLLSNERIRTVRWAASPKIRIDVIITLLR
jgi:hypothetical protein